LNSIPAAAIRLLERPLALAGRRVESLLAAATVIEAAAGFGDRREAGSAYAVTDGGIAVVPVLGLLVSRGDWLSALFGAIAYADIGDAVEVALGDASVRAVLLELDSPGGEIGGLFDLVDRIAGLRLASEKPLWAAASESALSAAYAVATAAERIYVTQTGEVGSVGVVAVHVDQSAADAIAGLKWTLVHAGAHKVDGNPHEPLAGPALAAVQSDVDALHAQLVSVVAANRGLPPEAVRATDAAIYRGARAVEIGLADQLGTVAGAIAELGRALDARRSRSVAAPVRPFLARPHGPRSETMTTKASGADPVTVQGTDPRTGDSTLTAPSPSAPGPTTVAAAAAAAPAVAAALTPDTVASGGAPDVAEALRAEFAEIATVAAQASRLGVAVDAAEAMSRGIKPDALRRSVLDALAARAEATAVVAAAPSPAAEARPAGESPIVRRAREHASAAGRA
jgi:signal peptide peptidase SppA